jgi:hypothetical protein
MAQQTINVGGVKRFSSETIPCTPIIRCLSWHPQLAKMPVDTRPASRQSGQYAGASETRRIHAQMASSTTSGAPDVAGRPARGWVCLFAEWGGSLDIYRKIAIALIDRVPGCKAQQSLVATLGSRPA